jgi:hypothetical protein
MNGGRYCQPIQPIQPIFPISVLYKNVRHLLLPPYYTENTIEKWAGWAGTGLRKTLGSDAFAAQTNWKARAVSWCNGANCRAYSCFL